MLLRRILLRAANSRAGLCIVKWLLRPSGVFLCYAVERRFADHFASRSRQQKILWTPYLVGVLKQDGATSLNFAIASTELDFIGERAKPHLSTVAETMSRHAAYFGARQVAYAGILPTVLRAHRLLRSDAGAEATCRAVGQAIGVLLNRFGCSSFESLVVLGGRGSIGRALVRHLSNWKDDGMTALPPIGVIDKGDALPSGKPILLVNCTLPGAIDLHAPSIPRRSVVLNEVYPAPGEPAIALLTLREVKVFHVSGGAGQAWPPFPDEYRGAIPCCAALADRELQVVMTALN